MEPLTIEEIREAVSGKIIQGNPSKEIESVSIDSRTLEPGDIFIAINGDRYDGHDFIVDAVDNGASALIVDRTIKAYPGISIILVKDTSKALQDLGHYNRMRYPDLKVIGITGSAGKTTTKDMLANILSKKYRILKTMGNYNNYYGLPLTLLRLSGDEEIAVLEMGMSGLGEIQVLAEIARPNYGIITNVGPTHLEGLESVANVARGKKELIEGLDTNGVAILNYDNDYVREMDSSFPGKKIIYYGFDENADIYADNVHTDEKYRMISFTFNYNGIKEDIELNKPGRHNIYNALAAIAVAREFNVDCKDIKKSLKNFELSSLRLDIREYKGTTIINDTYNANPLSMEAGIDVLLDIAKGRKIAVLGAMLELGSHEEKEHLKIGEYIYNKSIDILITVGELGEIISRGVANSGMAPENIYVCKTNSEAAEILLKNIKTDDAVLIKGSRGIKMEEIVNFVLAED